MNRFVYSLLYPFGLTGLVLMAMAGCGERPTASEPEFGHGDRPGELMLAAQPSADFAALTDQSAVKVLKGPPVSYDPLPPLKERSAEGDDEAASTADAGSTAAEAGSGGGGLLSLGVAVAKMARGGGLKGLAGLARPGAAPGGAPPTLPKPKLVEPKDELEELPASTAEHGEEKIAAIRRMADLDALRKILTSVAAVPIESGILGQVIAKDPGKIQGPLAGQTVVAAKWTDENTLELTVQIKISDLISALSDLYEGQSFEDLNKLGEDKALEVTGVGKAGGETKPTMPRAEDL